MSSAYSSMSTTPIEYLLLKNRCLLVLPFKPIVNTNTNETENGTGQKPFPSIHPQAWLLHIFISFVIYPPLDHFNSQSSHRIHIAHAAHFTWDISLFVCGLFVWIFFLLQSFVYSINSCNDVNIELKNLKTCTDIVLPNIVIFIKMNPYIVDILSIVDTFKISTLTFFWMSKRSMTCNCVCAPLILSDSLIWVKIAKQKKN